MGRGAIAPPHLWGTYMWPHRMIYSNQIFHGDKTRYGVTFYRLHQAPRLCCGATGVERFCNPKRMLVILGRMLTRDLFALANLLVTNYQQEPSLTFLWMPGATELAASRVCPWTSLWHFSSDACYRCMLCVMPIARPLLFLLCCLCTM